MEAFRRQKGPPAFWEQGPSDILQVVLPSGALPSGQDASTGIPNALSVTYAVYDPSVSVSATVDYLNSCSPEPIDTPITFLSRLIPGYGEGDGKVDINDLTIVLTDYNQLTIAGTPAKLGWRQGNFDSGPTVDINDLTIVLANYGKSVARPTRLALSLSRLRSRCAAVACARPPLPIGVLVQGLLIRAGERETIPTKGLKIEDRNDRVEVVAVNRRGASEQFFENSE